MPEHNGFEPENLPFPKGSPLIYVSGVGVTQVTYQGEPVLTFPMVDMVHQRPDGTARRTFNDNRERFVEGEDFITVDQPDVLRTLGFERPQGGVPAFVHLITRRGYLKLVKPMSDDRAWAVQGEMIDRYFAIGQAALLPDFTNPAAAARAFAEQYERAQVAVKTKAEIGSRREATAMNTASQAVKKAHALELELDRAKSYATIKRMSALYHGQPFDWRLLKQTAAEMGISSIDIFDANYGKVKAYHADVWREAYALEIPEGGAA